jgi:hypothetical protein
MPLRKVRSKRSVNTRGGGADAGTVGRLRDASEKVKKIMGRQARPKMPKDLIDKFRKTGPKKRKPMIPLRKKGKA